MNFAPKFTEAAIIRAAFSISSRRYELRDVRAFRFFWPLHARKPFNREEMSDLVVVQNDEIVTFF